MGFLYTVADAAALRPPGAAPAIASSGQRVVNAVLHPREIDPRTTAGVPHESANPESARCHPQCGFGDGRGAPSSPQTSLPHGVPPRDRNLTHGNYGRIPRPI